MRETDKARGWEAIARTTCAACLDRHDDGHAQSRVPARVADCPLRTSFSSVMDIVRGIHGDSRDRGGCALYAYLPLTVGTIERALPA